jgi:V/A-type H+/Na+-transporting ATPase subunit I
VIAYMDQILVVGRRRSVQEVLSYLQELGVVHIDPIHDGPLERFRLSPEERAAKERWDAVVARTKTLLAVLPTRVVDAAAKPELPREAQESERYLRELGDKVDALVAERVDIDDELDVIGDYLRLFRSIALDLAQLEGRRYLDGAAFFVANDEELERVRAALSEALGDRFELSSKPEARGYAVLVAVLKRDRETLRTVLSRQGIAELRLPDRYAHLGIARALHTMEERAQSLPKRRQAIENELAAVADKHYAAIVALQLRATDQQARYEALEDLAAGNYSFALQGWVPRDEGPRAVEALEQRFGEGIIAESRPADEHHDHDVPVKLQNPGWARPFELLLNVFDPPKYGGFDPTAVVAIAFPLIFGMIVGDMAFGLIFLLLGTLLRRRAIGGKPLNLGVFGVFIPPDTLKNVGTIINWAAAWTIVFGFVYGEFFGTFLEYWPRDNPVFYHGDHEGMIRIILFRIEEFVPVMLIALGIGILQILGGWGIRAYYGYKHQDMKHFWEGIGMVAGLVGLIVFAASLITGATNYFMNAIIVAGFAVFLVSVFLIRAPLMIVELIANGGNILSYLRIFAVGLSAALIAALATQLGFAIADGVQIPVLGVVLGIIVGAVINLLAVTIKIIAYTMQPLRLQYVEFFSKFGFHDESGRRYRPFRLLGGKS